MKIPAFLSIICLCQHLVAEEVSPEAKPATTPCPSCEKGTSRLAAFQGQKECPKDCNKLCCTGEAFKLSIPAIADQQSAAKVAFVLNEIDGAEVLESCLNSRCTTLRFDSAKVTKTKLINELNKAGIEVTGEKLSYKVAGMTCTGCSGKLTKVLTSTAGVIGIDEVSHESKMATLVINPEKTDAEKIAKVINETGYKVVSE